MKQRYQVSRPHKPKPQYDGSARPRYLTLDPSTCLVRQMSTCKQDLLLSEDSLSNSLPLSSRSKWLSMMRWHWRDLCTFGLGQSISLYHHGRVAPLIVLQNPKCFRRHCVYGCRESCLTHAFALMISLKHCRARLQLRGGMKNRKIELVVRQGKRERNSRRSR